MLLPSVMLSVDVGVVKGLFQIRPPGGREEMMYCFVDGNGIAVWIGYFTVEIEITTP